MIAVSSGGIFTEIDGRLAPLYSAREIRLSWAAFRRGASYEVWNSMAELKKSLCVTLVTVTFAAFSVAQAGETSPQRAATGTGYSLNESAASSGNASGGEGQDQPPPYIPPTHGTAQTLILGSITLAAGAAAFLAANKKDETATFTTTTTTTATGTQ